MSIAQKVGGGGLRYATPAGDRLDQHDTPHKRYHTPHRRTTPRAGSTRIPGIAEAGSRVREPHVVLWSSFLPRKREGGLVIESLSTLSL